MMQLELNSCSKHVERRKFLFLFFQLTAFLCRKSIQFCQSVRELFFLLSFWAFFCGLGFFFVFELFQVFFFVGAFVFFLCGVSVFLRGLLVCLFVWVCFEWIVWGFFSSLTSLVQLKGSNECQ